MAFLVSGLLGHLKAPSARGLRGPAKRRLGQTVLRGASSSAYSLEVYRREVASSLRGIGGVYCYARGILPNSSGQGEGKKDAELSIGYIGQCDDLGRRAETDRDGHLRGLDFVLVLREECEGIRAGIARDLIERHQPPLNGLLGSLEAAEGG